MEGMTTEQKEDKHEQIKSILAIPPEERTEEDIEAVKNQISEVKFLKQFQEGDQLQNMCKFMHLESYGVRTRVIEQGEEGDKFYIILHGRVGVYIRVMDEDTGRTHMKHVAELKNGDAFGELALLYGGTRAATVITSVNTDIIVLTKATYDKVVKGIHVNQIANVISFFLNFPILKDMPQEMLVTLASKASYRRFASNTVVIRQGDHPFAIYFIKSGRFKALRKIEFRSGLSGESPSFNWLISDPSKDDEEEGRLGDPKLLEIDEFGAGSAFADYALINNKAIDHSIISVIPSEVYVLDKIDFFDILRNIAKESFEQFKEIAKPYPSDRELRKSFVKMNMWTEYKKSVVSNVIADRTNKRWNFEHQLRKKPQIPKKNCLSMDEDVFKKPSSYIMLTPMYKLQHSVRTHNKVTKEKDGEMSPATKVKKYMKS